MLLWKLEWCVFPRRERDDNTTSSFNNGLFQKKSKQEGRGMCVYVCVCVCVCGGGMGVENMEFPVVLKK